MLSKMKEPGSAITHFIAMGLAIIFSIPLILKASITGNGLSVFSMIVFIVSMILLYGASAIYHTLNISDMVNVILRRVDHSMIFVLIAGSYTPICLLLLPGEKGIPLLIAIWLVALIGIGITIFLLNCPKWISSVIYIAMGWMCVFVFKSLMTLLPPAAFLWLLIGGIIYTAGGIIYALKLPVFNFSENFGNHEVFHVFVMGGSFCHFMFMYLYMI